MGLGEPDLGEQALSKAAEVGLTQTLKEVDDVNVDIRTDPLKLVQGKVESVTVTGEGLVMKNSLRMEKVQVETGAVAINPGSAFLGKIELTQAAEADAQVTLTQDDVNQAFRSDFIRQKMQGMTIESEGKSIAVEIQSVAVQFLDQGKVHLNAEIVVEGSQEAETVEAIVIPSVQDNGQRIALEAVPGAEPGSPLTPALLQAIMTLADLRNFDPGLSLSINQLEVLPGALNLNVTTIVQEIPQA
jgi:hypothetical protein